MQEINQKNRSSNRSLPPISKQIQDKRSISQQAIQIVHSERSKSVRSKSKYNSEQCNEYSNEPENENILATLDNNKVSKEQELQPQQDKQTIKLSYTLPEDHIQKGSNYGTYTEAESKNPDDLIPDCLNTESQQQVDNFNEVPQDNEMQNQTQNTQQIYEPLESQSLSIQQDLNDIQESRQQNNYQDPPKVTKNEDTQKETQNKTQKRNFFTQNFESSLQYERFQEGEVIQDLKSVYLLDSYIGKEMYQHTVKNETPEVRNESDRQQHQDQFSTPQFKLGQSKEKKDKAKFKISYTTKKSQHENQNQKAIHIEAEPRIKSQNETQIFEEDQLRSVQTRSLQSKNTQHTSITIPQQHQQQFMESLIVEKQNIEKLGQIQIEKVKLMRTQVDIKIEQLDLEKYDVIEQFFEDEYQPLSALDMDKLKQKQFLTLKRYKNSLYYGEIFNNQRHGTGILITQTKPITIYEGYWQNNVRFGKGFQIFDNSNIYSGFFANGKPEGFGCFYWVSGDVYTGQWFNGLKHGSGLWTGIRGDEYLGEWKGGSADGYGIHKWVNGERQLTQKYKINIFRYEGEFKNSLKHGKGMERFYNGDIYTGGYQNGKPSGFGEYIWLNGSTYKGQFQNGLRNGKGVWRRVVRNDIEIYDGLWINDRRCGMGQYTYANGYVYNGNFSDNHRHGNGTMRSPEGQTLRGSWEWGNFNNLPSQPQPAQKNKSIIHPPIWRPPGHDNKIQRYQDKNIDF